MMKRIPLNLIYGNPDQPRKTFDSAKLRELADSIRENGLKQPITVRADDDGKWMIVMGERRFRAMQLLEADVIASDILCHVSKAGDAQLAVDAIIENDQRVDVEPLEQAHSYKRMIDLHGFTLDTLSVKLGKPVHRIEERLRLLDLSADCQFLLAKGQITKEQAWYLAGLPLPGQAKMLKAINSGQCSTTGALKAISAAIMEEGAQSSIFGEALPEPEPASVTEINAARSFENRIEAVASMLRAGIDDNVIVAVRKVNPDRAATMADLINAMQKDLRRIETALRIVAVESAMAA